MLGKVEVLGSYPLVKQPRSKIDVNKLLGAKVKTFKYSPKKKEEDVSDTDVKLNQRLIQVLDEEEDLRITSQADTKMIKCGFFKEIFDAKRVPI